jgi:hypothetical protein
VIEKEFLLRIMMLMLSEPLLREKEKMTLD